MTAPQTTPLLTPKPPRERIAQTDAERAAIYQQRYAVTVDERGLNHPDADHDGRFLRDPLDELSELVWAERNGQVAGSLRMTRVDALPEDSPYRAWYGLATFTDHVPSSRLACTSELTAGRAWHNTSVVAGMVSTALAQLAADGVEYVFCHASPSTVPLYERLGYRRYHRNFRLPGTGFHVPLVLPLRDVERLRMLGSPLQYVLAQGQSQDTPDWLIQLISSAGPAPQVTEYGAELWQMLARQEQRPPVPLLESLDHVEIERLTELCAHIQFSEGDTLVGVGDAGDEMFVLLDGDVEARAPGGSTALASYDRGAVIGEMSLLTGKPRSAEVVALSDGAALVISNDTLDRAREIMPQATYRIMRNLAAILSERLFNTNLRVPRT